ncbi:MAG: DUF2461 domain-containing protein [Bacteroidota bacterium]
MHFDKTLSFFEELSENNTREWFNEHKADYQASKEEFETFVSKLTAMMSAHDHVDEKRTKIYRIYKDVRFSKDKTPYKTSWSANVKRVRGLRGGYYLQVSRGNSYLAGGFFNPNPADLLHIRKHLSQDSEPFRASLKAKEVMEYFGELRGEQVKSAPKGFSKDDENIDLLRYKQFVLRHTFRDKEVLSDDFVAVVSHGFKLMRPYFDVMTELLSTDLNGLPMD